MQLDTRLGFWVVRRWSIWSAFGLGAVLSLAWLVLQLDPRTLGGIRVEGEPLPRTRDPAGWLAPRAQAWARQNVSIVAGQQLITVLSRGELGASLDVAASAQRAQRTGHSGNPLLDLWALARSLGPGHDVPLRPRIDRARVAVYVRAIRNAVERPPVAGTSDREGLSIAGVPGLTLDTLLTAELLERTLREGGSRFEVTLRSVAAPQAVAIGTPDGIDEREPFGSRQLQAHAGAGVAQYSALLAAAQPRTFLPSQGCEPMDPPYEHFCQGPRAVPMPSGEAAALAERLELGTIQAVGQLINAGPRRAWIEAAGGPRPPHSDVAWPVASGRLWRRFGFTRRPPFEHLLHRGVDIGAAKGTPLFAVNPGIVAYSDNRVRGYGNLLVIVHDDASVTFSAHCRAIYVFSGETVARGQVVGEVGDTGLARGPHVHWEYHLQGRAVDPDGLFAAAR